MAFVNAPRVNLNQYDNFATNDLYGLNFLNTPYDEWWVVETAPDRFVLNVTYRANDGGYYIAVVTFRAGPDGFTYPDDSAFPLGIVASVSRGVEAYANLPRVEDMHFRVDGAESLGLSVFDILSDPLSLFAGDDTIIGGDNDADCDEISAGDGNDVVTGARTNGWYDMGRGNGSLDAGGGHDIALFDMSDRSQAVTYEHDNLLAVIRVGGSDAVTVRNVEQVEIRGSAFYDRLTGGGADDVLDLHLGGGMADGGAGADLVMMSFADMTVGVEYLHSAAIAQARTGTTVLAEVRNAERIVAEGGRGNDHLAGGDSADVLLGGGGDDHLEGGGHNDVLVGGAGDDLIDGGDSHDVFRLARPGQVNLGITGPQDTGDGWDTLLNIESIYGSSGDDRITGGAGGDTLYGETDNGPGGDVGNDIIHGGDGNDYIVGGRGVNHLNGGAGDDYIYGLDSFVGTLRNTAEGENFIDGGDGADRITGANGDDHILGGDGDDRIDGAGGLSWIQGGAGNDAVWGGNDTDVVDGGAGDDGLNGMAGDDMLTGGEGSDGMSGSFGNDILDGGAGNDIMLGGWGDDRLIDTDGDDLMRGDDGFDIVDYSGAAAAVVVSLYTAWDPVAGYHVRQNTGGAGNDILEDIQGVIGTVFDDRLTGRNDDWSASIGKVYAEFFDGGGGDDVIDAGSGADVVLGGGGDDLITGGLGDDAIDGGSGHDILTVSGLASSYRLLMDGDDFILKGPDGGDRLTGVENIRFSDGRVLELNRMYGPDVDTRAWADGRIPEALLSGGAWSGERPLVLPGPAGDDFLTARDGGGPEVLPGADDGDRRVWKDDDAPLVLPGADDAFVGGAKGFDRPEVLPGVDDWMPAGARSFDQPEVLPGLDERTLFTFDQAALLDRWSGQMLTVDEQGVVLDHYARGGGGAGDGWSF